MSLPDVIACVTIGTIIGVNIFDFLEKGGKR